MRGISFLIGAIIDFEILYKFENIAYCSIKPNAKFHSFNILLHNGCASLPYYYETYLNVVQEPGQLK